MYRYSAPRTQGPKKDLFADVPKKGLTSEKLEAVDAKHWKQEASIKTPVWEGHKGKSDIKDIEDDDAPSHALEKAGPPPKNIHLSGMEYIRKVVSQHLIQLQLGSREDENQTFSASFNMQWNLREFMKEQFGDVCKRPVGSVIALTGTATRAQATTVEQYLNRYWPDSGPVLLECLQNSLDSDEEMNPNGKSPSRLSITAQYSTTPPTYIAKGSKYEIVEVAQQLAWLGSALRSSPNGEVGRCQYQLSPNYPEFEGDTSFLIKFLVSPLEAQERSCWHALFFNPVVAYDFPLEERDDEEGLEISIHMMAALGGASQAVEFKGGLLLKGFSSMFVPLKRGGTSIQWHYIQNENDSRLPYWEVDDRCPGRALLDDVDYSAITTTRAFLGWWRSTTSHLGTADANYHNLDWSDTLEPGRSIDFQGGSLGFQNIGAGQLNFAPGLKDTKLHISRNGPYERIVKCASRTPVVLYDTVEKRGWLVPSSAVIAHIVQTRHFREHFSNNGRRVEFAPTDPVLDVYEGAKNMLLRNSSVKLNDEESGIDGFYFSSLVRDIWGLLEGLMDKNIKKESTADPTLHGTLRPKLRGWEFMDIVDERSPVRLKETTILKSNGGWVDLAQDLNAIVLFASGFEDIIQPSQKPEAELCHKWQRVPKEKDYLTASVSILNTLYNEAGSSLTKKHLTSTHLQWHRGHALFEACPARSKYQCACDRLQQIYPESFFTFGKVNPPGPLAEQGAVIFGQSEQSTPLAGLLSHQKMKEPLYSQENAPLLNYPDFTELPITSSSTSGAATASPYPETAAPTDTFEKAIDSGNRDFELDRIFPGRFESRTLKRPRENLEAIQEESRPVQRQRYRLDTRSKDSNYNLHTVSQAESCPTIFDDGAFQQPAFSDMSITHKLRRKPGMQLNPPRTHFAGNEACFDQEIDCGVRANDASTEFAYSYPAYNTTQQHQHFGEMSPVRSPE